MYTDVATYNASYPSPYNAAHDCVTTNMVYATSLHIILCVIQKDFSYELPKDLAYKSKKVSATVILSASIVEIGILMTNSKKKGGIVLDNCLGFGGASFYSRCAVGFHSKCYALQCIHKPFSLIMVFCRYIGNRVQYLLHPCIKTEMGSALCWNWLSCTL